MRVARETPLLAIALCLAAALVFLDIGGGDLHNLDEARHALVAEDALASGDWLTLHHEGAPYFNKAPLRIWLTALTFRIGKVGVFQVRLWSALFAVAAVGLTGLIGRRLYGARAGGWAALVLATTPLFLHVHCARSGEMDAALLGLLALAVWLGLRAADRPRHAVLAGMAAGLCGMTKHVGFAAEALLLIAAAVLAAGVRPRTALTVTLRAAGAAALVALPWHLLMLSRHGHAFIDGYFGREMVERAFGWSGPPRGPHFILQALKDGFWPWAAVAPWSVAATLADAVTRTRRRARDILPAVWLGLHLGAIAVARVKLPWYTLPLLPPLALLTGRSLAQLAQFPLGRAGRLALATSTLLLLLSPVAWTHWNPSGVSALAGLPRVDLLGALQGHAGGPSGYAPVFAGLAVAVLLGAGLAIPARRRRDAASPAWRLAAPIGLAVTALWLSAAPLRFTGEQPAVASLLTRAAAQLRPGDTLTTVIDPGPGERDDRLTWFLRRRGLTARRLTIDAPADSLTATRGLLLAPAATLRAALPDSADLLARSGAYVLVRWPAAHQAQ